MPAPEGRDGATRQRAQPLQPTLHTDTERLAHRLQISLQSPRACNAVLVKLVDQENLMAEYETARGAPNISICHVAFNGNAIVLPDGLALSC